MDESGGWLSYDERQHFWQNHANECQGFFIDTTGPVHQFTVGPPCWLPNIQTHKASLEAWRPCTDETWSQSLYVTSTGVNQDSALLNESWHSICGSLGHCYMMRASWLPGRQTIPPVGHHTHRHEDWMAHLLWNLSSTASLLLDQVVWLPHVISLEQ